jgi:hypothetical protein
MNSNHLIIGIMLVAAGLFTPACAQEAEARNPDAVECVPDGGGAVSHLAGSAIEGIASWYGTRFHGRKTASGERFNKRAMTCAHRTLPFGTLVRVTNMETNENVVVRVNDRGPFVRNRVIDLSHAAARLISIEGCSRVRVEVLADTIVPAVASEYRYTQRRERVRRAIETPIVPDSAIVLADSAGVDSMAATPDILPVSTLMAPVAGWRFLRAASRSCGCGMRIIDAAGRPIDMHGYTVVVAVTSRYASARAVGEALQQRGFTNVYYAITSVCGEHHYRVCVGFEPAPIALRMTIDLLRADYPTTTISYIDAEDYDRDHETAFAN